MRPSARLRSFPAPLLVIALLVIIAGCGSSTTATPTPTTPLGCLADKPEQRLWVRDTLAVTVQSSPNAAPVADNTFASAIQKTLEQIIALSPSLPMKLSSLDGTTPAGTNIGQPIAPITRVGDSTTAFFHLNNNTGCDATLAQLVNRINQCVISSNKPFQGCSGPRSGLVSLDGQSAYLVGASPDWVLAPSNDGGDHAWGSPGGPARPGPSSVDAATFSMTLGSGQKFSSGNAPPSTVVVLDTGYQLKGNHQSLSKCASGTGLCLPLALPLTQSSTLVSAASTNKLLSSLLNATDANGTPLVLESDLALPSDTMATGHLSLPYEMADDSGTPINVQDHGLFISGMIHSIAPTASIRLVRVLNDYGYGDLQSLLTALQTLSNPADRERLLQIRGDSSIILNMSLDLGPQLDCLTTYWDNWNSIQTTEASYLKAQGKPLAQEVPFGVSCGNPRSTSLSPVRTPNALIDTPAHQGLYLPIALTLRALTNQQISIVAAAGNGSTPQQHLDANLPAALCGVNAVAAKTLNGDTLASFTPYHSAGDLYSPASNNPYLDVAGTPSCLDISVTLGKGGMPTTTFALSESSQYAYAPGVGICGIYLQPLPGSGKSTLGMASWDGTSFSAGIVSGLSAATGSIPNGMVGGGQPCDS